MKRIYYPRRKVDLNCYSRITGKMIDPYSRCPICQDIYKECPHMTMGFGIRISLLSMGIKCSKKTIPSSLVRKAVQNDELIEVNI